jgi:hypothetical protein
MEVRLDLRPYQVAIVVGVDHKIQHFIPGIAPNDPCTQLRLRFHEFLREITGYPVDVICEETKHGAESIAETVANRVGIRYCTVEMSPRESHLVNELLGAITDARVVVVICGVRHMPTLVQALQSKFRRVERYDVTAMAWFDPSML